MNAKLEPAPSNDTNITNVFNKFPLTFIGDGLFGSNPLKYMNTTINAKAEYMLGFLNESFSNFIIIKFELRDLS